MIKTTLVAYLKKRNFIVTLLAILPEFIVVNILMAMGTGLIALLPNINLENLKFVRR